MAFIYEQQGTQRYIITFETQLQTTKTDASLELKKQLSTINHIIKSFEMINLATISK